MQQRRIKANTVYPLGDALFLPAEDGHCVHATLTMAYLRNMEFETFLDIVFVVALVAAVGSRILLWYSAKKRKSLLGEQAESETDK